VEELLKVRRAAAAATGGTSSDAIYDKIVEEIFRRNAAGKVLDFGAGARHLTEILCRTSKFVEVDAADILDYHGFQHPIVRNILTDLNGSFPGLEESYDLVVAAEVIEHLENPRFLAREWFRVLKKGGYLILSTPNNESWRSIISLLVRGHFAAFTGNAYPAHITALLRSDLERILREAGFSDISFTFTNHGGIPGKPIITWQTISFGILKGLRYSDNVVCVGRKP
jgi:2-polyprenyl-3-methyl-5-hydroxy-6-metoxy-1,4-benzoquinol methylase